MGFWSSVGNAVKSVASSVSSAVSKAVSSVSSAVRSVASSVSSGVRSVASSVSSAVKSAGSYVSSAISSSSSSGSSSRSSNNSSSGKRSSSNNYNSSGYTSTNASIGADHETADNFLLAALHRRGIALDQPVTETMFTEFAEVVYDNTAKSYLLEKREVTDLFKIFEGMTASFFGTFGELTLNIINEIKSKLWEWIINILNLLVETEEEAENIGKID